MNVTDGKRPCVRVVYVAVVASARFPQVGGCPFPLSCGFRRSLLDRFQDVGHIVNLFVRVKQDMNVIWHEHEWEDSKVEFDCGFVDSIGEELADSLVAEIRPLVIG